MGTHVTRDSATSHVTASSSHWETAKLGATRTTNATFMSNWMAANRVTKPHVEEHEEKEQGLEENNKAAWAHLEEELLKKHDHEAKTGVNGMLALKATPHHPAPPYHG